MSKQIHVGKVAVGGGAPVSIQSMCNTKTDDVAATVAQIHALEDAGCEIIRVAVPDEDAAKAVDKIKEQIDIPLIADIHFNYKLALMCAERGIDALRINPGNIGGEEKVKAVADICRQKNIPIRIGVNGGSLEKELRAKYHLTIVMITHDSSIALEAKRVVRIHDGKINFDGDVKKYAAII